MNSVAIGQRSCWLDIVLALYINPLEVSLWVVAQTRGEEFVTRNFFILYAVLMELLKHEITLMSTPKSFIAFIICAEYWCDDSCEIS